MSTIRCGQQLTLHELSRIWTIDGEAILRIRVCFYTATLSTTCTYKLSIRKESKPNEIWWHASCLGTRAGECSCFAWSRKYVTRGDISCRTDSNLSVFSLCDGCRCHFTSGMSVESWLGVSGPGHDEVVPYPGLPLQPFVRPLPCQQRQWLGPTCPSSFFWCRTRCWGTYGIPMEVKSRRTSCQRGPCRTPERNSMMIPYWSLLNDQKHFEWIYRTLFCGIRNWSYLPWYSRLQPRSRVRSRKGSVRNKSSKQREADNLRRRSGSLRSLRCLARLKGCEFIFVLGLQSTNENKQDRQKIFSSRNKVGTL